MRIKKDWILIALAYFLATAILYGYYYFLSPGKMNIVYKNWDGPSYTLVAKSLYDPQIASNNNYIKSPWITPEWTFLPAHFPLFPLSIRALSGIGYFQAMLAVTQIFSFLTLIAFYELVKYLKISKNPLLLTLPMIFLPPRWFIVSHVGSSEPMFLFFLILFFLFAQKRDHWKAGAAGALAQLVRPQGSLLALGVGIWVLYEMWTERKKLAAQIKTYYPYLLIPLSLLSVFLFYQFKVGSFWAFFESIAPFRHSQWPPFRSFVYPNANVETFWQEVNAYNYVLYLAAIFVLWKKKLKMLATLGLALFLPLPFIAHSDVSRYALPLMPLAFIAYKEIIERKEFALAALIMSPAIYAYAINFMFYNHAL